MIDILSGKPFGRVMYSKHAWRDDVLFQHFVIRLTRKMYALMFRPIVDLNNSSLISNCC